MARTTARLEQVLDSRIAPGLILFSLGMAGCLLVALVHGVPTPRNHDQFSYLLAADTFASGRLSNPTHPFWHFFETFHVIFEPTYVSKYPPAQGLVLAFGLRLFDLPILGVWICAGLLPAVTFWMAKAWIPGRWAVLAGGMVLMQFGLGSYWAQSYWGGSVAAIGGGLVFGAVGRLIEAPNVTNGMALALGLGVLANSRPFEGLIAAFIAMAFLTLQLLRAHSLGRFSRSAMPAFLALLVLLGGATQHYNRSTTGDPTTMPYQVHERTYSQSSLVPGTSLEAPDYRHEIIRDWHETERASRERTHTLTGFLQLGTLKT
ncbi:MAG: hypothetical protein ACR2QM_02750, partial [Longimicrobiales bacterium]